MRYSSRSEKGSNSNMKLVWTNGCFDVLHRGHIELFKYAKSLGDYLIVGIDSDKRIKESKGPSRPVNSQQDRRFFLESIKYVDKVVIFSSSFQLESMVKMYKPEALVVGSEYKTKGVVGVEHAKKVHFFDRIKGYSTTNILNSVGKK